MPQLIAVVEVVRGGVIEVHGQLDQAKPERTRIEVEVTLRIAGDRGDVMNPHRNPPVYLGSDGPEPAAVCPTALAI